MKRITKLKSLLHRKQAAPAFDREAFRPVIRCSICTGEQVAGLKELSTGRFREVMLIRTEGDLEEFRTSLGIGPEEPIETVY